MHMYTYMYTVKVEITITSYCIVLRLPSDKRKIIVAIILKLASYVGCRFSFEPKDRILIIFTDNCYF